MSVARSYGAAAAGGALGLVVAGGWDGAGRAREASVESLENASLPLTRRHWAALQSMRAPRYGGALTFA
jgi:hypothetical protein